MSGHAPEHPCLQAFLDGIEFRRICRFRSEEVPTLRWYVTLPQLASTDSSSGLPSGGDQSPAHCRMDSDGWLDPGAASGGLRGALPLGAPVDGIRRLRMRGARREPRQMPADGLGRLASRGPGSQLRHLPARVGLARHNKAIFGTLFAVNELIVLWRWLVRP